MASHLRSLLLTQLLAGYLTERFRWYRSRASGPGPSPPATIPLKLIVECEILASQASLAYNNRGCLIFKCPYKTFSNLLFAVQISWDVLRYTAEIGARPTGYQEALEAKIRKRYPADAQNMSRLLSNPCIIHDLGGRIICWSLPEVLLLDRQASLFVVSGYISSFL
jgi:hypothetical protein